MATATYDYTIERPRYAFDPLAASRSALTAVTSSLKQQTPNHRADSSAYARIQALSDTPLVSYQPLTPLSQLPSNKSQNTLPMKGKGYIDRGTVNLTNTVLGQSPQVVQMQGAMMANQDRDNVKISTVRTDGYYLTDPGLDSVQGDWRRGFAQNANSKLDTKWDLKAPLPGQTMQNSGKTYNAIDNVWVNGRQLLPTVLGPGIDSRHIDLKPRRNCY